MGPRVEILTMLACDQLKPEYTAGRGMEGLGVRPWGTSEPVVSWVSNSSHTSAFGLEAPHDMHGAEPAVWVTADDGPVAPPPSDQCKTDPVIQAAVARLQGGT